MTTTRPRATPVVTPWRFIALAALPAFVHAVWILGRIHPDEWFQTFEIAVHQTYGYGIVSWEWLPARDADPSAPWGIRNWAVPLVVGMVFRASDLLGIGSVIGRRVLVAIPQLLLHAAMLGAVYRLAARRIGTKLAHVSVALVAAYPIVVWFGVRTMSESLSGAFLVWGLERLDDDDAGEKSWAWGGALLGLAEVARYGSAAAIAPALVWLLVTKRIRPLLFAIAGGAIVALGLGLLDRLTWGSWFHSLVDYLRFNVISGRAAADYGSDPWWKYFSWLHVAPWAIAGLLVWRTRAATRAWLLLVPAFVYFTTISITAHKEPRFVYPALLLLAVAAAPAFVAWVDARWRDGIAWRALAVGLAAMPFMLFAAPSPFAPQRPELFRVQARAAHGSTGLVVVMDGGVYATGGFFFAGGNIPWSVCETTAEECFTKATGDRRTNRGIHWTQGDADGDRAAEAAFTNAGFRKVDRDGRATYFER